MPLLVFAGLISVYIVGVSRVVFGGDSGDIILSYFFVGVPHPPGYPLNTLLGAILTRLIPIGTFAFKANAVSAIYQAVTVGLLYYLTLRLTKNSLIALATALILAFVSLYWLYAHVAEVFQLTLVLITVSLIFLQKWLESIALKRTNFRFLILAIVFWGLAAFHHQTAVLLAPAYLWVIIKSSKNFKKIKRVHLKLIGAFLTGAIPYLYVFWAAWRKTPVNWNDPSNLPNFWRLITRADYGTFTASPELIGFSLKARAVQLIWYFNAVKADFTVLGVLLAVIGAVWLYFNNRLWFWFLTLAFLFSGPFFVSYASFPPVESFLLGVSERFFLTSYLFLAIFVGFGMFAVFNLFVRISSIYFKKKEVLARLTIGLAFLIFPLILALINWPKTDLSQYKLGKILAEDILKSAAEPGLILLQGDTATFNSQYSFYVDNVNSQSIPVMTGRLRRDTYRNQIMQEHPQLAFPVDFAKKGDLSFDIAVADFIKSNYQKLPIYSLEQLPIDDDYKWVQEGMLLKLYKTDEAPSDTDIGKNIDERLSQVEFSPDDLKGRYRNYFDEHIGTIYARIFTRNGFELLRSNNSAKSRIYFDRALDIDTMTKDALLGLGIAAFQLKECDESEMWLNSLLKINPHDWTTLQRLGFLYKECFVNSERADEFFQKAELEKNSNLKNSIEDL